MRIFKICQAIFHFLWINFFVCANSQSVKGPPFIVTSVLADPFLMVADDPASIEGNERYEGFSKDFADKLFEKLNRNYVLQVNTEGTYGIRATNGSWNGMIGALMAGSADFAIADFTVSASRAEVVDFSVPFMQAQLGILLKRPSPSDTKGQKVINSLELLNQYTTGAWFLIGVITALTISWIQFMNKQLKGIRIYPKWVTTPVSVKCVNFGFILFLLFVLSCLAGNFIAIKLGNIILQSSHSPPRLPINSIQELGNQSEIDYGILRSGSTFHYFRSSMSEDLIESMYLTMVERNWFVGSYAEGIKKVRNSNGSYAFLMESHAAKFATVRKPCDLVVVPQLFGPKKGYGVAIPKVSPKVTLKELDLAILDLNEQGILTDLENKWFKDQSECDEDTEKDIGVLGLEVSPVTANDMKSTFIILAAALGCILVFAIFEYLVMRKKK